MDNIQNKYAYLKFLIHKYEIMATEMGKSVELWIVIAQKAKMAVINIFLLGLQRNELAAKTILHANPFLMPLVPYVKKENAPIMKSIVTKISL